MPPLPGRPRSRARSRWTSAGVPAAITRPKSSTTTWSETRITSPMWCSTISSVSSSSLARAPSAAPASSSTSPWLRPEAGSSSASSRGLAERARELDALELPVGEALHGRGRRARASPDPAQRLVGVVAPSRAPRGGPSGGAARRRRSPERPRWWAPSITFSRTLSAGTSARCWNVRAIPSAAISCGLRSSSSSPSKRIEPAVGVDEPADAVEQRRLAGAVGADQPAHRAVGDRELHLVERRDTAEADGQASDLEHLSSAGLLTPVREALDECSRREAAAAERESPVQRTRRTSPRRRAVAARSTLKGSERASAPDVLDYHLRPMSAP